MSPGKFPAKTSTCRARDAQHVSKQNSALKRGKQDVIKRLCLDTTMMRVGPDAIDDRWQDRNANTLADELVQMLEEESPMKGLNRKGQPTEALAPACGSANLDRCSFNSSMFLFETPDDLDFKDMRWSLSLPEVALSDSEEGSSGSSFNSTDDVTEFDDLFDVGWVDFINDAFANGSHAHEPLPVLDGYEPPDNEPQGVRSLPF